MTAGPVRRGTTRDRNLDSGFAGAVLSGTWRRPHTVVLRAGATVLTGGELADRTYRVARALARHGVGPEHRVAIAGPDTVHALVVRYGAALLGAATALCPDALSPEFAPFVRAVGADVLVTVPDLPRPARSFARSRQLRLVLSSGPSPFADVDLDAGAGREAGTPVADRSVPERIGVLTTGDDGVSAVPHTFGRWLALVRLGGTGGRHVVDAPLSRAGQLLVDRTLTAGGSVVLPGASDHDA